MELRDGASSDEHDVIVMTEATRVLSSYITTHRSDASHLLALPPVSK